MSDLRISNQTLTLYLQCFEQLLPNAGDRVRAVQLDWWDLDRFLGLAFHMFVTETDTQVLKQVAQLLPKFGAKAVLPLVVILNEQNTEPELRSLAVQSINRFDETDLVTGLFHVLKMSEDESFDHQVAQLLTHVGLEAKARMRTFLEGPASRDLALRILPRVQASQQVSTILKMADNL
jgi:hypothetical protein